MTTDPNEILSIGLDEVIEEVARLQTTKMAVAAIAVVESYDAATQKVKCRPVVRGNLKDEGSVRLPPITNVPVAFPAGGNFSVTYPLNAGDFVFLVFADRSISEWLSTGQPDVTPASKRRFSLSDAVAIPAGRPFAAPLENATADELIFGQDEYDGPITNPGVTVAPLQVRVTDTGIAIGDGGTTNDLLNILDRLLTAIASEGGVIPISAAAATAELLILAKIKR